MTDQNQQLQQLETELQPYKKQLATAADSIIEQDVSAYPIFILHRSGIDVGIPINAATADAKWLVNASTLEEFVTKQLIEGDRVDNFKEVYKDATLYLCLFVVDGAMATFVFLPRD